MFFAINDLSHTKHQELNRSGKNIPWSIAPAKLKKPNLLTGWYSYAWDEVPTQEGKEQLRCTTENRISVASRRPLNQTDLGKNRDQSPWNHLGVKREAWDGFRPHWSRGDSCCPHRKKKKRRTRQPCPEGFGEVNPIDPNFHPEMKDKPIRKENFLFAYDFHNPPSSVCKGGKGKRCGFFAFLAPIPPFHPYTQPICLLSRKKARSRGPLSQTRFS